jgi:hypothetical protein
MKIWMTGKALGYRNRMSAQYPRQPFTALPRLAAKLYSRARVIVFSHGQAAGLILMKIGGKGTDFTIYT